MSRPISLTCSRHTSDHLAPQSYQSERVFWSILGHWWKVTFSE
ncbi:MAG: hypothetical protein E3J46_08205 [Desulfobacteraceae bacterium]|nr:MAG: hypothetical protein E3J46_08205 [Desulfobacteraceae bacterium]